MIFWSRGAFWAALASCLLLLGCETSSTDADQQGGDAGVDNDVPIVPPKDGAVVTDAHIDGGELSYVCEQVDPPTECPSPAPTFADISPIIGQRCSGPCHNGAPNGPWPLATYQHIADWQDDVRSHLLNCVMPPLDGGVPITTAERILILTWIRCGLPK